MKKLYLALVMALMFGGIFNVKAMTEDELKTKFKNGYVINGETIKPDSYQMSEIERYLNKYDVSATDADFISEKVDEIYNIAKASGAKTFTDLPDSDKTKIVAIVAEISNNTSVKASLTKNGVLTIFESDGKTPFTEIKDKDITKQTGENNMVFVIASVAFVFGLAYVAKKAIKNA